MIKFFVTRFCPKLKCLDHQTGCQSLPVTAAALGRWGFVFRPPMTAAEFITKSSLIHSNARLYWSARIKAEACT